MLAIGGFVPLTTIDYPGHLAAVIFCQGCPFRCSYCHNPTLISRINKSNSNKYVWGNIKSFLIKRRGLLEAVVFSGGEPTLQKNLLDVINIVKELGFKVGLHTAGPYPERLKSLISKLDWVGMDVKAPFDEYESITKIPNSGKRALESTKILIKSGIACEFRTTVDKKLINDEQILSISNMLKNLGVTNYKLQTCRSH